MAHQNYSEFLDYVERHSECEGIERAPSVPGETGKRFVCSACGEAFEMTAETAAFVARLRQLEEKGGA
jgi:hypothetical protein